SPPLMNRQQNEFRPPHRHLGREKTRCGDSNSSSRPGYPSTDVPSHRFFSSPSFHVVKIDRWNDFFNHYPQGRDRGETGQLIDRLRVQLSDNYCKWMDDEEHS